MEFKSNTNYFDYYLEGAIHIHRIMVTIGAITIV